VPATTVGIAGAGLLGRLLAWRLARIGLRVEVFDLAPGPGPRFGEHGDAQHAAGFTAAGMLSPLAELDNAGPEVAVLGWRSIDAWRDIAQALAARPAFAQRGSLLLAHRSDLGAAQRVLARLARAPAGRPPPRALDAAELADLEPALQGATHAWLLPGEAQIDSVQAMLALQAEAEAAGVAWHWRRPVAEVQPGRLLLADGSVRRCDLAVDVRGVGARPALPVRGVRGEMVWLRLPGHGLRRPVRLLHPRHRVYLVPRAPDTLLVGASEVESEDRSEVSLRSAVELMSAAHSVMPALAEARIARLDSNLRPALPDNEPRIDAATAGLLRINGLFRHGWLLAPALVEDALAACGLEQRAPLEVAA
jgi:glycine oxidase